MAHGSQEDEEFFEVVENYCYYFTLTSETLDGVGIRTQKLERIPINTLPNTAIYVMNSGHMLGQGMPCYHSPEYKEWSSTLIKAGAGSPSIFMVFK
jgi:hypothetical protein